MFDQCVDARGTRYRRKVKSRNRSVAQNICGLKDPRNIKSLGSNQILSSFWRCHKILKQHCILRAASACLVISGQQGWNLRQNKHNTDPSGAASISWL